MTPSDFLIAKSNMLSMLRELRDFEEGETAAIVLLIAYQSRCICYSNTIGIVHADAAIAAMRKLAKNGYLYSIGDDDKRYRYYRLTAKGYVAYERITNMLKDF